MKRLWYLVPAMAWTIIIIIASLISSRNFKGLNVDSLIGIDKIVHLGIYGILTFLSLWGLSQYMGKVRLNIASIIFLVLYSIGLGILMEVLQKYLTTSRGFDMYDIIANIIGALVGSAIFLIRYKQTL